MKKEASTKEKPLADVHKDILKAIPGKFIVKTPKGYVAGEKKFTNLKSNSKIFDDFNKARRFKELYGGKVIKL